MSRYTTAPWRGFIPDEDWRDAASSPAVLKSLGLGTSGSEANTGAGLMQLAACPPGDRNCRDAKSYRPGQDGTTRTVRSRQDFDELLRHQGHRYETRQAKELGGAVMLNPDGSPYLRDAPLEGRARSGRGSVGSRFEPEEFQGKIYLPRGAKAAVHSHPNRREWSIAPGEKDDAVVNTGRPSYIVRDGKKLVLEIVDGQWQARDLHGNLSPADWDQVQPRLDEFQRKGRR